MDDHIIDVLIAERAPRLTGSALWPAARPPLYRLLGYHQARAMAAAFEGLGGAASFDHVSRLLDLDVEVRGLANLPAAGRCVLVVNHPTGLADGVAVWDGLKAKRPDMIFLANSDALRVSRRLSEVIIPIEWVEAKRTRERTRETLTRAKEAFEAERCVVIYPAGRLARREAGVLTDPEWQTSAISLARRHKAPIVPVHLAGPSSTLFHLFDLVSKELRDITLFHELLNKRRKAFTLTLGRRIDAETLDPDPAKAIAALKTYVERVLPLDPERPFA